MSQVASVVVLPGMTGDGGLVHEGVECATQTVLSDAAEYMPPLQGEQDASAVDDPGKYPLPGGHEAIVQGAQASRLVVDENTSEVHAVQDESVDDDPPSKPKPGTQGVADQSIQPLLSSTGENV